MKALHHSFYPVVFDYKGIFHTVTMHEVSYCIFIATTLDTVLVDVCMN